MLQPVILSGGAGSRLWPVSREHYPKQFLRLNSEHYSLLQESALRLQAGEGIAEPLVVCNEEQRFLVAEQLKEVGCRPARILLEPVGRNTAPAVALAALLAEETDPTTLLLVMPADHIIENREAFRIAVEQGKELAVQGYLVTFGINPSHAHRGYGYIRLGDPLGGGYRVAAFVEKPDAQRAAAYLARGDTLWNSGIFLFQAGRYLQELEQHAPDILLACRAAFEQRHEDLDFLRIDAEAFCECRGESIDYAVMEETRDAAVLPMDPGWRDIGDWDALFELKSHPACQGNAAQGDVLLHDTHDSLIHSQSRLVATLGIRDLVIVETEDAILVADRHRAQEIGGIAEVLKAAGRKESQAMPQVFRPWGHYRTLVLAKGFQVKEIVVTPGHTLSLQMHHHRAEHWVVVAGTAKVTLGDDHDNPDRLRSFMLSEDESTYISLGTVHRLENPGVIPLKLIEVQTGSYLGEDDIVRFDDAYGYEVSRP